MKFYIYSEYKLLFQLGQNLLKYKYGARNKSNNI